MKTKQIFICGFIAILTLAFVACKSGDLDSGKPVNKGEGTTRAKAIELINGQWRDTSIAGGTEQWYFFTITQDTTYRVWWNDRYAGDDTKTVDVRVSAYYNNDTATITGFSNVDASWRNPPLFTPAFGGKVYLKVTPFPGKTSGTYGIVYSTDSNRPGIGTPTATGVRVTPDTVAVLQGHTQPFNALVLGSGNILQGVTWAVEGAGAGTAINGAGLLTVSATEPIGKTFTVRATSISYPSFNGTAKVTIIPPVTTTLNKAMAGYDHTVAIRQGGVLSAWGRNNKGQVGDGTTTSQRNDPVKIGNDTWVFVAAGYYHTVAIQQDGSLWAWGANDEGQIGNGSAIPDSKVLSPVKIGNDTDWAFVAAGSEHTVAIKNNGTLWAWGYNSDGQLGNGSTSSWFNDNPVTTPIQIGSDTNWTSVAAGYAHTVAIKTNGTLWAWGDTSAGQLGNGVSGGGGWWSSSEPELVPVQIGNNTTWVSVTAGGDHTAAIRADGSLWAWGGGFIGHDEDDTDIPVRIGTAQWKSVSAGYTYTVGIQTDGTLWAWGVNDAGQLGNGTRVSEEFPVKISNDTTWVSVSAADAHTVAIKADGSLWAWGNNLYGQLGDSTTDTRETPIQIE